MKTFTILQSSSAPLRQQPDPPRMMTVKRLQQVRAVDTELLRDALHERRPVGLISPCRESRKRLSPASPRNPTLPRQKPASPLSQRYSR